MRAQAHELAGGCPSTSWTLLIVFMVMSQEDIHGLVPKRPRRLCASSSCVSHLTHPSSTPSHSATPMVPNRMGKGVRRVTFNVWVIPRSGCSLRHTWTSLYHISLEGTCIVTKRHALARASASSTRRRGLSLLRPSIIQQTTIISRVALARGRTVIYMV